MTSHNNTKKNPLTVLGDFAWDVLIRTNSELLPGGDSFGEVMIAPGGSAANVAVWASRCGLKTAFVGKVGRDRFGQMAADDLEWEKVDTHLIGTSEHRTAAVSVWIDHEGQRSMVSGQGADFYLLTSELPVSIFKNTQHLHLSAWSLFRDPPRSASRMASKIVKESGGTVSLDPASFQIIGEIGAEKFMSYIRDLNIDIFFPNFEEGRVLSGEKNPKAIIRKLSEMIPGAIIALKLDSNGALIMSEGKETLIPAATNSIIDATGAGDAFAGAFLSRYLQGCDISTSGKFAVKISAWVVNHISARPHSDKALENILQS